jgi:hypothetical protein
MYDNKQLFDFMLERVHEVGVTKGLKDPQAFGRWFAEMHFPSPRDFFIPVTERFVNFVFRTQCSVPSPIDMPLLGNCVPQSMSGSGTKNGRANRAD